MLFSWLCLGTVVAPSARQPNMEQAIDSWDDTDLVMDVARLRRNAEASTEYDGWQYQPAQLEKRGHSPGQGAP